MQTFLPFADFTKTAQVLDDLRLGKQRVEVLQIANALLFPEKECPICGGFVVGTHYKCDRCKGSGVVKAGYVNHPATVQWRGYELQLLQYGMVMCREWVYERGRNDTVLEKLKELYKVALERPGALRSKFPPWLGNEQYHSNHRGRLLYKAMYETKDERLKKKMVDWYLALGWKDEPVLENLWPSHGDLRHDDVE